MAAKEEVKVFGAWGSPFSRRIEIALKLKGVEYEYIEEDISNKSPLLLKYNPIHKKIPVLLHNGNPLPESLVILEYIDDTWKHNPILPHNPYDRALARFWARFLDDKCLPAIFKVYKKEEKDKEKAVEEAYECLEILENELKEKRFFGGEEIGMVDIVANFIGFWLRPLQEIAGEDVLTADKFPKLFKWTDEFANNRVVEESLPARDKLVALLRARFRAANT